MMTVTCNSRTQEAEAGGALQFQAHLSTYQVPDWPDQSNKLTKLTARGEGYIVPIEVQILLL